jgi:RNA polymerase sigma-70 factor (ECF subfamily)
MNETTSRHGTQGQHPELELLVARCQLGDQEAIDSLVEAWHGALWGYAISMTGDPEIAEDVVQEGWFRILRGIGKLRDASRLRAWLFSIVRRAFMDRLRHRYRHSLCEPLEEEPASPEPALEFEWEENEMLYRSLQRLSSSDRETIVLFYLRELDLREVSEVLNIPVGTVKSRLHRARRDLRRALEDEGVKR